MSIQEAGVRAVPGFYTLNSHLAYIYVCVYMCIFMYSFSRKLEELASLIVLFLQNKSQALQFLGGGNKLRKNLTHGSPRGFLWI